MIVLPVEIRKLAELRIKDAITALENVADDLVDGDVDVLNDMRAGVNEAHIITSSLHDLLSRAAAYQRAIEAQLNSKLSVQLLGHLSVALKTGIVLVRLLHKSGAISYEY